MMRRALCTLHRRALLTVVQEAVAAVECSDAPQLTPTLTCSSLRSFEKHVSQHGISQQGSWHKAAAHRGFITSTSSQGSVVSFPLAQTGEGISECELMQWFVKVGALLLLVHAVSSFRPSSHSLHCLAQVNCSFWQVRPHTSTEKLPSCAVCAALCRRVMWLTSSSPSVKYRVTRQQ